MRESSLTARFAVLLVLGMLVSGCILRGQDSSPTSSPVPPDRPTPVPVEPGTTTELSVYFPRLFEDGSLGLRAARRTIVNDGSETRRLLEALLAGPNGEERATSHYPPLDRRIRVLQVQVAGERASIEFDEELRRVIGRPFSEIAYWSIVYTATEAAPVERVTLTREGAPLLSFGSPPVSIVPEARRGDAPAWARPR